MIIDDILDEVLMMEDLATVYFDSFRLLFHMCLRFGLWHLPNNSRLQVMSMLTKLDPRVRKAMEDDKKKYPT